MVDKLISDLDVGTPATNTEVEILLNAASISTRSDLSVVLALYDALTSTLTNKTFDANGTGNSITNIENDDIAAAAAIAFSKLGALTDGNILVGDASNVAVSVNPSGDIDISNAGVFSIVAGVIVDADITDDTISLTKLVPGTKGEVIGTDGTTRQLLAVGTNDQVLTAASGEITGLKWAAAGAGSANTFAKAVKTADETVNNSSTLQDDDTLKFTPSINKTYSVLIFLLFNGNTTADIKHAVSIPTGATSLRMDNGNWSSTVARALKDWTTATQINLNGNNQTSCWFGRLIMSTTAGDFILQWAQNSADVSDTKVLEGSFLVAYEEG